MSPSSRQMSPPTGSLRQGSEFDPLYLEYAGVVARWVRHLAGPHLDVEDLVQEIFLVVRRRLPEFRGDAKLATWLYRITERVVRTARRQDRLRRFWPRLRRHEVETVLGRARLTPVEELERRQSSEMVYRILDRLPEKYRTVLILFEREEMSGEDIAALCGLKLATVWVRLHRGRAQFLADFEMKVPSK
jgi:RNA polymerase sigma-70 factor (ECF subfamily)